jgi:hypothetical protein
MKRSHEIPASEPFFIAATFDLATTYHVELVLKENKVMVYLLDIGMKNPTIKDSSVSLKLVNTNSKEINCSPEKNYFICGADIEKTKTIEVKSIRNKVVGKIATYKLPLKFE